MRSGEFSALRNDNIDLKNNKWPDTGMCRIHGADDDISHAGLADNWCDPCNSSRKQSGDVLWYRFDNTYEEYRIWSGRVYWIMIQEKKKRGIATKIL